jgi:hypothetical protein
MDIDPIRAEIDILEFDAPTGEWLAKNHPQIKTFGELAAAIEPYEEIPDQVTDEICRALGYWVWMRLRGFEP